jgi:hypothetical protein
MLPVEVQDEGSTREFAISCLKGEVRRAAESLSHEVAIMSADEILGKQKITEIDYLLRKNLWKQVELAQKGAIGEIEPVSIYKGVCSKQNFYNILDNPYRMAWILLNPQKDMSVMEAGLGVGLRRLLEFISKPVTPDTAGPFLKAIEILLNRVHGPVVQVQKIDKRSAHVNLNKPVAPSPVEGAGSRLEELKSKILESTRDVTPNEASDDEGETGINPG